MRPDSEDRPARIGFLYNHEQIHQIPHSAPILAELATLPGAFEIHAFLTDASQRDKLARFLPGDALRAIHLHLLPPSRVGAIIETFTGGALPLRRIGNLMRHRSRLAAMDILVVPETTSIFLKTRLGVKRTKLVYSQHGAGDRAVGFKKIIRDFDHVLVCGERVQARMLAEGIIREGEHSVVGYPKFDAVKATEEKRLFNNRNLTVLYNPHFHPFLSSWYSQGRAVLDHFAARPHLNLIVAPHVMLYERRLHISTGPLTLRATPAIPDIYRQYPNILIDEGSFASVDMTYTRAADVYLGDASSQVYEFIERPRPCIFLNCHGANWQDDPNYAHWHLGEVIDHPTKLDNLLDDLSWHEVHRRPQQEEAFRSTFGGDPYGGAARAAEAIASLAARSYIKV